MACGATLSLKRSLEFDPVHSPFQSSSPKRRRFVSTTPSIASNLNVHHHFGLSSSISSLNNSTLTTDDITAHVAAECKHRKRDVVDDAPDARSTSSSPALLNNEGASSYNSAVQASSSDSQLSVPGSPPRVPSPDKCDAPLLTFRQVSRVCEKMIEEREGQLHEQYEHVLVMKIAEQYEAFLKFNQDQLQRKYAASTASYVS